MLTSALMLAKFLLLYFLLFYFIPTSVLDDGKNKNWKDKYFISLIHSHVFIIIVVHLLVAIKLYETLSLLFVIIVTCTLLFIKGRSSKTSSSIKKLLFSLIQATDENKGLRKLHNIRFADFIIRLNKTKSLLFNKLKENGLSIILVVVLMILATVIRFKHSITHSYFGASDPYVHLKWAKLLGQNEIYVDGVYPYGFEAIISALHVTFQLDPYIILRFLGPFSGVLIAFSIYFVLRKHRPADYSIAIFALIIYFISSYQFSFIWRQYSSLSMEYGAIFILPGICYFLEYVREVSNKSLIVSIECFLLTILIHPYAAICLFISYLVLFVIAAKKFRIIHILKMLFMFAIASIIGILPLAIGLFGGVEFHGESINFVKESVGTISEHTSLSASSLGGNNTHIIVFLIVLFFLLIYMKRLNTLFAYPLIAIVLFIFYRADVLGIPAIMLPYRIEVVLVLITTISIALVITILQSKVYKTLTILSFVTISYITLPSFELPKGNQQQYDEAVEAYLKIKNEFPIAEWTIVSTVEEYPLVIDYGWHYNLTDMLSNITNGKEMKFTSKEIFFYVEKIPLGTSVNVQNEATKNLELPNVDDTLDFYRKPEYRTILQQKTWSFINIIEEKNPNIFEIYIDTPKLRVYKVSQDPLNPINFTRLVE
ncbi:MAG: hypothetical protein K0S34_336 [Bacillales bacterium]|jgi:hypothetical protein|nr:hypothetical protein [Bacillales bacterium]